MGRVAAGGLSDHRPLIHAFSQRPLLAVPQLPTPVCTADFPDAHKGVRHTSPPLPQKQRRLTNCSICLESMRPVRSLTLPCGHTHHRVCIFSVLTVPVLGAQSMLRCPLCRYSLDRYDLRSLGCVQCRFSPHPTLPTTFRRPMWRAPGLDADGSGSSSKEGRLRVPCI